MFLYIFKDGSIKQVAGNPTVIDILGVGFSSLRIFKNKAGVFYELKLKADTIIWEPVEDGKLFFCTEGRHYQ